MEMTKDMASLCVTLVDEVHGDLSSRIFAILLDKGQCTASQLAKYTALAQKEVELGLLAMNANNLLYFYVDKARKGTSIVYEANPTAAYDLVRRSRVLDMIQDRYGPASRRVVHHIQNVGHTSVSDLRSDYKLKMSMKGKRQADEDPFASDEVTPSVDEKRSDVRSLEHLDDVLCQLLAADILEVVTRNSFMSPDDRYMHTYNEMKEKHFPQELRGAKQKEELERRVTDQLRELRDSPHQIKCSLGSGRFKLRKLAKGDISNGFGGEDSNSSLDPNTLLRVNYEKCLVLLRNEELVKVVSGAIGETTGHVYSALLQLSTEPVPRCRLDPILDAGQTKAGFLLGQKSITTSAIFDNLDASVDLSHSIGTAAPDEIDMPAAERIRKHPPNEKEGSAGSDGDDSADEVEDISDDDGGYDSEAQHLKAPAPRARVGVNGSRHSKVTFEDATAPGESRQQQMRQHLLLLCEDRYRFVRHCGRGLWTVDFQPLMQRVREMELDTVIERKIGRHGVRLAQLLRKNGKLDEKMLMSLVLMRKADLHSTLQQMQIHGFADIQEVPRDNSRAANRTMFLWYCHMEKCFSELLDTNYRAMLRCLQTRQVHKANNKEILDFVELPYVKEQELGEVLERKYLIKYEQYCDAEAKFKGQLTRLDIVVAILRDY